MIDIFTDQWQPEAVILAAGNFPTTERLLSLLEHAPVVVCCDGAATEYISRYGAPSAIVGDCDSLSEDVCLRYAGIIHRISEQETNDLTKTFHFTLSKGYRRIAILGATGKREDHTLGNISLLMRYASEEADVRMYTDHGVFVPCHDDCTFRTFRGQEISIFNFGARNLRGEGMDYPMYDYTELWQGTLNVASGDSAAIHGHGWYMLFLNYENA